MTVAAAYQEVNNHSAQDLALAHVGGSNASAVAKANAILDAMAQDMGLSKERVAAVNDNHAKHTAAVFASALGAAGMNFANVGSEIKAPVAAPNVADKGGAQLS